MKRQTASPINFFRENVRLRLTNQEALKKWLTGVCKAHGVSHLNINYIFCSDEYLLKLNRKYLRHNTLTDIITFQHTNEKGTAEADIFISVERVRENAGNYRSAFADELHRVMVHGVLHLLGYSDKNNARRAEMRKAEDKWLAKRRF